VGERWDNNHYLVASEEEAVAFHTYAHKDSLVQQVFAVGHLQLMDDSHPCVDLLGHVEGW